MRVIAAVVASFACALSMAWPDVAHAADARAQRFVRFGPADGLPPEINALSVDRAGFLWAATVDGLARYDGVSFRFWRRMPGLDSSLRDNTLIALALDRDDRVWAASRGALSMLDARRRGFVHVRFDGAAASCDDDILALAAAPDGAVWMSGYNRVLCRIDPDGSIHRITAFTASRVRGTPNAMLALSANDVLIGTSAGLHRYRHGRVETLAPELLDATVVFQLKPGRNGEIWIGTDLGLFRLAPDGRVTRAPWRLPALASNAVVSPRDDGGYWIGTSIGLFTAESREGTVVAVRPPRHEDGLSSGVFEQVRDHEGGWWFASYAQGLSYLPPSHGRFDPVEDIGDVPMAQIDPIDIAADGDGGFWLAGARGVYALPEGGAAPRLLVDADALGVGWLRAIARCADGALWVSGYYDLVRIDPRTGATLRRHRYTTTGTDVPQALFCAADGAIWVSLYRGGIDVYDREGRPVRHLPPAQTYGRDVQAFAILQAGPDGAPWFFDQSRLYRWNGARFEPVAFEPVASAPTSGMETDRTEALQTATFVAPETWWIARYGTLERYRVRDGRLQLDARFGLDDGLPAADAGGLLVTADGQVWLGTQRGLLQYDTHRRRARLHGMRDGLPGLDFSLVPFRRGSDGRTLAMAKEGLVRFDPDTPLAVPPVVSLSIDAIELRRGEDTVPFDLPSRASPDAALRVTMQPGDRDLRIVARRMSFADPATSRYRFRLHGFDPDWVQQEGRGERVFSSLPPGVHRLDVQGAGTEGAWSPTRRIEIVVLAPWWRRGWAFALYAALAVGIAMWVSYLGRLRMQRRHAYQMAKQRQALAEEASQAKSRFLANLGHEVRTPMTGVLGMSELLLSSPLDARQQGHVRSIRVAGEHLLRLVNDALDLARVEAGRLELASADFDLHALVDEAVALMRPLAVRKSLRFVVERDAALARGWHGDATRIRQILLNLLGNAIKFTERGEVTLRLSPRAPRGVRIDVIDTGPGLDDEQQRRLFRRFEQAEGARTASRYGGSGLGLAICQELAVAMGGGIELRSAPGEGACFIVRLPLDAASSPLPADDASRHADDVEPLELLLVEDDAIVADALSGLLRVQGHRVTHAGHALAALTSIATGSFDVALIDLDLPGMDGLALARHLRTQGFDRPMIAITARADADAEPQAHDAGFDAFLRKPLTGEMLVEALGTLRVHA